MSARVLQGNVFDLLPTLRPGSVDVACTSPPYWMLRSYLPKGHALKPLELGSEPTPAEYVANMVRVFGLVRTALADHGTVWLNVGDTYATGASGRQNNVDVWAGTTRRKDVPGHKRPSAKGIVDGNLCLIPQRLAIALQDAGWLVRSVVVWHKPAPMPQSVSGWAWRRCRVKVKAQRRGSSKMGDNRAECRPNLINASGASMPSATQNAEWADCPGCKKCRTNGGYVLRRGSWRPTSSWEPVLMLAKAPSYYCDGEAVKTPAAPATVGRDLYTRVLDDPDEQFAVRHDHETVCDGANLRDVWTIAAEPLREKHYAAFPSELVHRCLAAGTSARGYCVQCGKPWARVVEAVDTGRTQKKGDYWDSAPGSHGNYHRNGREAGATGQPVLAGKTLGWRPTCSCPEQSPRPATVLDPFAGSCRTGVEALRLGLDFVGVELNPEYVEMGRRILLESSPLFAGVGGEGAA